MTESTPKLAYFMPSEVALHNKLDDCWHSCFGRIYDLTKYLSHIDSKSPIAKYLLAYGGKDVSHWFDPWGRRCGCYARLKRYVEPSTGISMIMMPFGNPLPEGVKSKMIPVAKDGVCLCSCCTGTFDCRTAKSPNRDDGGCEAPPDLTGKCWSELEYIFNSEELLIGRLTKKARPCRITNVLTGQTAVISVCEEDSIGRIQERASLFNRAGASSYTWKYEGKPLDESLSLTENGIPDERDRYLDCGLPDDNTTYVPNLLLYYNDDLLEL